MVTPTQNRQYREDSHQWHMLLDKLNLPHDTPWQTIAGALNDWRVVSDAAEVEINRLKAELAAERRGERVLAF